MPPSQSPSPRPTSSASERDDPRRAWVVALRALAQRRLTEVQLWSRLERKGFSDDAIASAVVKCKQDGYLDDRLFAELYIIGTRKAVGDARLVAALVRQGIDLEIARGSIAAAPATERERCLAALLAMERKRPGIGYPSAARALERLGFPASIIYATLRARIGPGSSASEFSGH